MSAQTENLSFFEETDEDRRRRMLADNPLSLDMVSALAGDRWLTEAENLCLCALRQSRGTRFFSDILYSITHQHYSPVAAELLWNKVLWHKDMLSDALGRSVGVAVAALDYLSNITDNLASATLVSETHIHELVSLSLRDGLTGLFNHSYFYQQIDFEVRRSVRYGSPVSLMLMDIDDFKSVNDTYGHRIGDGVLSAMGNTLMRVARDSDVCCRYGGEEFAVILPLADIYEADSIANRLRIELAEKLPGGRIVTVSIGVATSGEKTLTYRDVVERADRALYKGKRNGKNRVMVAVEGDADTDDIG